MKNGTVLEVNDLHVRFHTEEGTVHAVDGVSFSIPRGSITALVGESGCGKSVTALSILRLIQRPGEIFRGNVMLYPSTGDPIDVSALDDTSPTLFHVRGGLVSMIFQEPMTALSPVHTVGNQICEAITLHQEVTEERAREIAASMLRKVGIPGAVERLDQYPFEMSGGMRQRAVIAMALACNPQLLIADEPTTALDVTIQAQILGLMKDLQAQMNTSVLLITHDLGVVAQMADFVEVMYLGRIVEEAPIRTVMKSPKHPYTIGLLGSLPSLNLDKPVLPSISGYVPSLLDMPDGCSFHPRCPFAKPGLCDRGAPPELRPWGAERQRAACHRLEEIEGKSYVFESTAQRRGES